MGSGAATGSNTLPKSSAYTADQKQLDDDISLANYYFCLMFGGYFMAFSLASLFVLCASCKFSFDDKNKWVVRAWDAKIIKDGRKTALANKEMNDMEKGNAETQGFKDGTAGGFEVSLPDADQTILTAIAEQFGYKGKCPPSTEEDWKRLAEIGLKQLWSFLPGSFQKKYNDVTNLDGPPTGQKDWDKMMEHIVGIPRIPQNVPEAKAVAESFIQKLGEDKFKQMTGFDIKQVRIVSLPTCHSV